MADQKYSDKCPTAWLPVATIAGHPNHISTQPGRLVPGRGPLYDHGPLGDERVIQRHHSRRGLSYGSGTASGYPAEAGGSHTGRMYYPPPSSSHPLPSDHVRQIPGFVRDSDTDRDSRASAESSGGSSPSMPHGEQQQVPHPGSQQMLYHGTPHQSVQTAGVCTTPGKCQGGGELCLARLAQSGVKLDVPEGFSLVGTKSPMLPGMTLVAAVDNRYLPDENTGVTMLGFGGNCVGCGAKGFRYFTEFSTHINLRLATQPKKQKHIKYYVITDSEGILHKGQVIPWKGTEGKKRIYPVDSPYSPFSHGSKSEVPCDQSVASSTSGPPQVPSNPRYLTSDAAQMPPPSFDRGTTHPHAQSPHYAYDSGTYSSQVPHFAPPRKKTRWESGSTDGGVTVVHSDDEDPNSPAQTSDGGELPTKPWLAAACGVCPVLLLCQHSIPNIPCSIEDIIISDLLVGCFDPPLVSDHDQYTHPPGLHSPADSPSQGLGQLSKTLSGSPSLLTTPMAILLTIQYFSQLVEDDRLSREDIESLLQDGQLELSASFQQPNLVAHSNILTHVQLPTLANLAATPSKGRVKVVTSPISLDNAIMRAFKFVHEIHKHNHYKFPKVPIPEFIFILSTSQQKPPEFCMLVTSLSQAKYLHEAMIGHPVGARITDNIAKLEQLFRLSSDALEQMVSNFEEVMGYGQLVYIPFNGFPRMKVLADEAVKLEPKVHSGKQYWKQNSSAIYAAQNLMAKQLMAQVCTIAENSSVLDLNLYSKVSVMIVVPPITTLFNQTARRLAESGLLSDLGLESESSATQVTTAKNYIIQHDSEDSVDKLKAFLDKIEKQSSTLFVLIFDQVQFYSSPRGVLDLPYYRNIMEASNMIPLFITATPYLFQTNCSFIDPDNEVYWTETRSSADFVTEADEDDSFVEEQDSMYFGMKEYCDSIKWTHQFPLIRQDDAFERMALRTSRTAEDVDVSVLRCYLLIRHYAAAIMWTAGIKPAEPHCSLKTLQIMREIMESPVRNADGSGAMLAIRIPSSELATLAYETLKNTRDRLGFQYRFAIVHDSGTGEFEVEEYFLMRLRMWRMHRGLHPGSSSEDWVPECYQDLLDLPCIVLLSGRERTGETFPRSLKYIDLRLIDRGFLYRSSLELEFSAIACYIGTGSGAGGATNTGVRAAGSEGNQGPLQRDESGEKSSDGEQGKDDSGSEASVGSTVTKTSHYSSSHPLPVILISRSAFKAFQTDFYGYPKHLLLATTPQTRWVGHGRPHLVTTNPGQQSLYYRQWTEPKPKNVAASSEQNSGTVIETRSASGIVISPDIPDVIEEDGMPAVETMSESTKQSTGNAEQEQSTKPALEGKTSVSTRSQTDSEEKKATANKNWQSTKQAMLSQKSAGVPGTSSDSDTEMTVAMASSSERTEPRERSRKYHMRAMLFSGPPQVGKTGAYLHFTRLLQRMLLKLQNVDVYDESSWVPYDCALAKTSDQAAAESLWPKFDELAKVPFSTDLTENRYCNASRVRLPVKKSEVKADTDKDVPARKSTEKRPAKRPLASVMLGAWAACDTYHHCDSCKHYRDGMGPSAALCYPYKLKNDQTLQFVVPPTCEAQFIFTEDRQLQSLKLPRVLKGGPGESVKLLKTENSRKEEFGVKTPVMTPSTGRYELGLLNLYHAMDGRAHVHLVFVKQCEVPYYHKAWPNHVIVGLPVACDREGLGAARYYIKEFATENYLAERKRHGLKGKISEDVWPFFLMMDDSCVMWENLLQGNMKKDEEESEMPPDASHIRYASMCKVLEDIEAIPSLLSYGMVGLRQYSSKCVAPLNKAPFSRCVLNSFVLLNVSLLQDVQYDSSRFTYEDLDFSLRVESSGIVSCRLNHYAVFKKFIPSGGKTVFRLQQACGADDSAQPPKVVEPSEYSKLVNAPDREDTHFFSVPAQYLLELYMANAGSGRLFPTSAGKPNNPVLVIDCYVNLGPKILVEYVSSRVSDDERKSRSKTADKPTTKYSGLLLFFCGQKVTAQFLQQFQFTSGARLCLVCRDRNKLRQEVARLDLEECWRFRLRDEFQTANNPDEPSLFLLTGKHDK